MNQKRLLSEVHKGRIPGRNKPLLFAVQYFERLIQLIKANPGKDIELEPGVVRVDHWTASSEIDGSETPIFTVMEALNLVRRVRPKTPKKKLISRGNTNFMGSHTPQDSVGESVYLLRKEDAELILQLLSRTE